MVEDLEGLSGKLSLTESERETVDVDVDVDLLQNTIDRGEKCLIIQLLTLRSYNQMAFKQMLRRVWRPSNGLKLQELDSKFLLAEFEDVRDKERVVRDGPWTFDEHLVLVKDFDGFQQVQQIQLTKASFWVRIHDLPLAARSVEVGQLIGKSLGHMEDIDLIDGEIAWGEFMRIRVCIDITKSLLRGKKLCIGSRTPYWVRFSYEQLPDFCFICRRIGHAFRDCDQAQDFDEKDTPFPYGQWLRGGGRGVKMMVPNGRRPPSSEVNPVSTAQRTNGVVLEDVAAKRTPPVTPGPSEPWYADLAETVEPMVESVEGFSSTVISNGLKKVMERGPQTPLMTVFPSQSEASLQPVGPSDMGLTNPPTVGMYETKAQEALGPGIRALRELITREDPTMVFLQETKLKTRKMEWGASVIVEGGFASEVKIFLYQSC
ncbi:hypothetical protein F2P56_008413 [Juglans regia]|uniref:CCHC-type domain-containing protein n=1 Tax=Juglans regia TaxID=51240 RepID=A0A834D090_JUGRE|nr:hypothetical protein F2P56_008413 [Juglans regia]